MSLFGGIKEGETILLCKKRLDLKKEDYTCYVNYEYLVKKISPDGYELYEELEEDTFTITNEQYSNHMQPNYCMTSHSLQGVSIPESEGEITLLDLFSKNSTHNDWFAKLISITDAGCPSALPRFTSLPPASTKIVFPFFSE